MRFARCLLFALAFAATASAQLPVKHIVEDLRIDADRENVPSFQFLLVGPHGEIVTEIYDDQQFRFYDSAGHRLGTFGRKGSGPKEFRGAASHFVWVADTFWVYDGSLKRVTYISRSLELIRIERFPRALTLTGLSRKQPGHVYLFDPQAIASGRFVGTAVIDMGVGRDTTGQFITTHRIFTADRSGGDGAFLADVPKPWDTFVYYRPDKGTSFSDVVPFSIHPLVEFSYDGSRFATLTNALSDNGGSYTLTVCGTRGDTLSRRTYPFVGTPIPPRVADSAIKAIESRRRRPPVANAKLAALARAQMSKFYAPFNSMVLGLDGTTWLQSNSPHPKIVAFDRRGTPLFEVPLPPRTRVWQANLTTLWAIQRDDDDVGSIVRFRIK